MKSILKQIPVVLVLIVLAVVPVFAQGADIEMADKLRQDGKIWVVVGVVLLIFAGVIFYLIRLDFKISRLEKQSRSR
jgi:protein-S-isoprenylcysteine O-methyltransferase Ste14